MKKLLALTLAALLIFAMISCNKQAEEATEEESEELAEENVYENFTYAANAKGELEITGYQNSDEKLIHVTIPDKINDRPIVGIGEYAFAAQNNIKTITIPATVGYIGDFAFAGCEYLSKIELPGALVTIGQGAFKDCTSLEKATFPQNLLSIGACAFQNCKKLTSFTLPNGILTIEEGAFQNCSAITKVTIPSSIIDLGDGAFIGCTSLYEVNLLGDKTLSAADDEILTKINTLIAESGISFASPAEVASYLEKEENGYYLSGISATGVKFIWDTNTDKVYGALTATDEKLVASINQALVGDTSKNATNALELMFANMKSKGFDPKQLNTSVASDKYVWDPVKNEFTTIYLGTNVFNNRLNANPQNVDVFSECTANMIVSVTTGSVFAEYAKNAGLATVDPATANEGTKIFSNNTLAFYYPEAWKITIEPINSYVYLTSGDAELIVRATGKNFDAGQDHWNWTTDDFDAYINGTNLNPSGELSFINQSIEQLTSNSNLAYTKISFTITDGTTEQPLVIYLITIGNTTYTLSLSEAQPDVALQEAIEDSFMLA